MLKYHKSLTPEKWCAWSLVMQMANVGADVSRAFKRRKEGDHESCQRTFERSLELLDLTIADPKHTCHKELRFLREVLVEYFIFENKYQVTEEWLEDFFYRFGYLAAVERGVA